MSLAFTKKCSKDKNCETLQKVSWTFAPSLVWREKSCRTDSHLNNDFVRNSNVVRYIFFVGTLTESEILSSSAELDHWSLIGLHPHSYTSQWLTAPLPLLSLSLEFIAHIRERYWSDQTDEISLWLPDWTIVTEHNASDSGYEVMQFTVLTILQGSWKSQPVFKKTERENRKKTPISESGTKRVGAALKQTLNSRCRQTDIPFSPVSLLLAINDHRCRCCLHLIIAGVIDTGDKLIACDMESMKIRDKS